MTTETCLTPEGLSYPYILKSYTSPHSIPTTCQETPKDPDLITHPVLHGAGSPDTAAVSYTGISLKANPSEL